jgi:hypothetical protein
MIDVCVVVIFVVDVLFIAKVDEKRDDEVDTINKIMCSSM